jgi:hypothetical protein
MKNKTVIAEQITLVPKKIHDTGESVFSLLNETGYPDFRDAITIACLQQVISQHPDCVRDWLGYSEDKRADSGWFFREEAGRFVVGYLQSSGKFDPLNMYDNNQEACAEFIKAEIEDILTPQGQ